MIMGLLMGPIISILSHDISDKEIILRIWDFLISHSIQSS